jgi:hypothetical protein
MKNYVFLTNFLPAFLLNEQENQVEFGVRPSSALWNPWRFFISAKKPNSEQHGL